jgi:hypothetical protein
LFEVTAEPCRQDGDELQVLQNWPSGSSAILETRNLEKRKDAGERPWRAQSGDMLQVAGTEAQAPGHEGRGGGDGCESLILSITPPALPQATLLRYQLLRPSVRPSVYLTPHP